MDTPETPDNSAHDGQPHEPLLSLDTLVTRPVIAIDKVPYEILSSDELSIIDSHRFGVWGRRIQQLADTESKEEEAELEQLIDKVASRVAVGVPEAVYATLSGGHKQAIVDVFTGLLLRNRLGVAEAIAKAAGVALGANLPTGAKPSPGSSGSSAATRNGGWLKRLPRWCGLS